MSNTRELEKLITHLTDECDRLKNQVSDLKEVRDKFIYFFENSSDYIYIKDKEHRFLFLSNALAKITNHDSWQDVVGKTDFDIFPEELAKVYFEEQKKVIEEGKELIGIEEPYYDNNGKQCWASTNKKPMHSSSGEIIGLIGISRDITKIKKLEEELRKKASYDNLTGLLNREVFFQYSSQQLKLIKRNNQAAAIIFIDLDQFKPVNDIYGHKAGDYVLVTIAERLKSNLRNSDIICRFGGDEFIVFTLLDNVENDTRIVADNILKIISTPILFNEIEIEIGCSIGISHYPKHGDTISELVKNADEAMYKAKNIGENIYQICSSK
jgi:diguanylate cyclase (GGDEF)-like protein/PAS domain S-box-containing protein